MIKESFAKTGKRVTTLSDFDGGIGMGYLLAGVVYEPLGNGFCRDAKFSPSPVTAYLRDNGSGYKEVTYKTTNILIKRINNNGTKY